VCIGSIVQCLSAFIECVPCRFLSHTCCVCQHTLTGPPVLCLQASAWCWRTGPSARPAALRARAKTSCACWAPRPSAPCAMKRCAQSPVPHRGAPAGGTLHVANSRPHLRAKCLCLETITCAMKRCARWWCAARGQLTPAPQSTCLCLETIACAMKGCARWWGAARGQLTLAPQSTCLCLETTACATKGCARWWCAARGQLTLAPQSTCLCRRGVRPPPVVSCA